MRSSSLALVTLVLTLAACGDDGDGVGIDASTIDAPPGGIDAAIDGPMAQSALGTACTGDGQGDCPAGFACLNLNGASGRWCSEACADIQDPSCEDGYTGPGFPACAYRVDFGGGVVRNFCAVFCEDAPGGPTLCPEGSLCNGTCPGALTCTFNVTNMQTMQVLGKACV